MGKRRWHIEYAVDAFGEWDTEAETEEEAWEKLQKTWGDGEVAPPEDFSDPDADDATVEAVNLTTPTAIGAAVKAHRNGNRNIPTSVLMIVAPVMSDFSDDVL